MLDTHEAIRKAKSLGLDLVEVSSNARPPVCKIVDYGKYKYDQKKLKKEQPKRHTVLKRLSSGRVLVKMIIIIIKLIFPIEIILFIILCPLLK